MALNFNKENIPTSSIGKLKEKYGTLKPNVVNSTDYIKNNESEKSSNWFLRGLGTISDVADSISHGVLSLGEGVIDLGAGIVGAFGNDKFKEGVKEFQQRDLSREFIDLTTKIGINPSANAMDIKLMRKLSGEDVSLNPFDNDNDYSLKEESYINDLDTKAQNTIRGVASAVGQVLATAGIGQAVGGAAAAISKGSSATNMANVANGINTAAQAMQHAQKVGQVTSMIMLGASAAGGGMVEAELEGASYSDALKYGLLSGATELGIEAISGGVGKVLGNGMSAIPGVGTAINKANKTVIGKVGSFVLNGATEGLEEVASDYVNPLMKMIYKGSYEAPELEDVTQDFIVGTMSSLIINGAIAIKGNRLEATNPEDVKEAETINKELDQIEALTTEMESMDKNSEEYKVKAQQVERHTIDVGKYLQMFAQKKGLISEHEELKEAYKESEALSGTNINGKIDSKSKEVKESTNFAELNNRYGKAFSKKFQKDIENNKVKYVVHSNKEALESVQKLQAMSYEEKQNVAKDFITKFQTGQDLTKNDIAQAAYLGEHFANSKAERNVELSINLLQAMSLKLTSAGQTIQAAQMMKYFTPQGRMQIYKKMANKQIADREKRLGKNAKLDKNIVNERRSKYFDKDVKHIKKSLLEELLNDTSINLSQSEINSLYEAINKGDNALNELKNKASKKLSKFIDKYQQLLSEEMDRINDKYDNEPIFIPKHLIDEAISNTDPNKAKEINQKIIKSLDEQYQYSFLDKVEQYRILAMLANPKTHIRNFIGNYIMNNVRKIKNNIAAVLESKFIKDQTQRTKTTKKVSQDMKDYISNEVFSEDLFDSELKYNIANKKVFTSKKLAWLEKIREFNGLKLEQEDFIFLKKIFIDSLGKWATARGYTINQLKTNQALLDEGVDYAIKEANTNTFKEASDLANKLNEFKANHKIAKIAISSIVPFTKTPINIVKIGFRYTPFNLMKGLFQIRQVNKGKISVNQCIDNIAMGATGTGVLAIGMLLASMGVLGIGDDDNTKERNYNKALGIQGYSLRIGNMSYTLDWMSPAAIPLFTGVALFEELGKEGEDALSVFNNVLWSSMDPIMEMSMLSSLSDALTSYQQSGFQDLGKTSIESYVSSFLPTIGNQLGKVIDPNTRVTTATRNNNFGSSTSSKNMKSFINRLIAKVPGLSLTLEPYIDVWGNEVKNYNGFASFAGNALEQTISPGWWSSTNIDDVDLEIDRLLQISGDNSIIPSIPNSYYTKNGQRYDMTAKEYTEFKRVVGQNSKSALKKGFKSSFYLSLSEEDKIDFINDIYSYSKDYAKSTGKFSNPQIKNNFNFDEFILYFLEAKSITASSKYSKKENVYKFINNLPISYKKRNLLLDSLGY